jgi:hypothetical protein
MENEPEPIRVVTALEHVRKRPQMYFSADIPLMSQLVDLVIEDVTGPRTSVEYLVELSGSVAVIAAAVDWMQTDKAQFQELWTRFVIPTPVRINSHRSELLLAAVCDAVRTDGPGGSFGLGDRLAPPNARMLNLVGNAGRWLAFRLAE